MKNQSEMSEMPNKGRECPNSMAARTIPAPEVHTYHTINLITTSAKIKVY
jgi:hypothetical protein